MEEKGLMCAFNKHIKKELEERMRASNPRKGVRWSKYQTPIFDSVENGTGNLVVVANAGSGKSTLLEESARRTGLAWDVKTLNGLGHTAIATAFCNKAYRLLMLKSNKYQTLAEDLAEDELPYLDDRTRRRAARAAAMLCEYVRKTLTDPKKTDAIEKLITRYGLDDRMSGPWRGWVFIVMDRLCAKGLAAARKVDTLEGRHIIDYTDQVWIPNITDMDCPQYPWIMVDEAQDLSRAQQDLMLKCLAPGGRVLAVGDPNQAIYGFNGADAGAFTRLKKLLNAQMFPLSICYRCPTSHLDLARQIVPAIENRPGADRGVVMDLAYEDLPGMVNPGDLILCRTNLPIIRACYKLLSLQIPAKIIGRDVARELQGEIVKIGAQKGFVFDSFIQFAKEYREWQLNYLFNLGHDVESQAVQRVNDRIECIFVIYESNVVHSIDALKDAIEAIFSEDEDAEAVNLSTVHRAKGMEADRVFLLVRDPFTGKLLMPHPMATQMWELEQEYNLLYVARTRARKVLVHILPEITSILEPAASEEVETKVEPLLDF